MKIELLSLLRKYRIPISDVGKEVLIDRDLLQEAADFLGNSITVPYAFPGLIFRWVWGHALEVNEKRLKAVEKEYGVPGTLFTPPDFFLMDDGLYLEPISAHSRESISKALVLQPDGLVIVARESALISLVAEPGWREYTPVSVISDLFYEKVDIFRLENQAFFPPGRSSMGMAFLSLKKRYDRIEGFYSFLRRVFSQRRRKLRVGQLKDEKRPWELEPGELLGLFETTME